MRVTTESTYLGGRAKLRIATDAIRRCLDQWDHESVDSEGFPAYCRLQAETARRLIQEFIDLAECEKRRMQGEETPPKLYEKGA